MFGIGRPSKETAVINSCAIPLAALGLSDADAVAAATGVVDEVLAEFRPRGIDPLKSTQGTEYTSVERFTAPRLAAGLTLSDIKTHWNRPLLLVFAEVKMRELFNFVVVDMARQQGKDISAAGRTYKKTFPRYGDPSRWDPEENFNVGLTYEDRDIYPEFAARVEAWRQKMTDSDIETLIEKHGTLNAGIRAQMEAGVL
jgi:hypothetical protein